MTLPLFPVFRSEVNSNVQESTAHNDQGSFDFKMCLSDGSLNLEIKIAACVVCAFLLLLTIVLASIIYCYRKEIQRLGGRQEEIQLPIYRRRSCNSNDGDEENGFSNPNFHFENPNLQTLVESLVIPATRANFRNITVLKNHHKAVRLQLKNYLESQIVSHNL